MTLHIPYGRALVLFYSHGYKKWKMSRLPEVTFSCFWSSISSASWLCCSLRAWYEREWYGYWKCTFKTVSYKRWSNVSKIICTSPGYWKSAYAANVTDRLRQRRVQCWETNLNANRGSQSPRASGSYQVTGTNLACDGDIHFPYLLNGTPYRWSHYYSWLLNNENDTCIEE